MNIDLEASDPVFTQPGKRSAADAGQIVARVREALALGDDRPWRLVSSRLKLAKTFFEVEETTPAGPRRLIGKVSSSKSAQSAFASMQLLWNAGLRPPAPFTIAEPVAYLPDQFLLLQEKAPGAQLLQKIKAGEALESDAHCAAGWLSALQQLKVDAPPPAAAGFNLERCRRDLPAALPAHAARVESLLDRIAASIEPQTALVPSHGDFHPMNVYIAPDRVTAIDLDTFAAREPMTDVAYFLAQSAIMGFLMFQSFAPAASLRAAFLDAYRQHSSIPLDPQRTGLHMALAFLRSRHSDFCILHTHPDAAVEPFLAAAEQCLNGSDLRLAV